MSSTSRSGTVASAATYNQTNTAMKTTLDDWYKTNIYDKGYGKDVVDNIFCNDRQLQSEVGGSATGPGYGNSQTYYASYYRLQMQKNPNLKCGLKNDSFTVNDTTKGNGSLTYPVGLLTTDEVSMAGLRSGTSNPTNYLYTNQSFWLFSPAFQYSSTHTSVFYVNLSGSFGSYYVENTIGARPTVSLDGNLTVEGDGTLTNPYKVI